MVALQQPFDARAVAPQTKLEPIEEGWQPAVMTSSELKPTQANDGGYLELVFDIIEGQHKGRKMYARLNIYNNNEQAVEIARGNLSAICWSTGVLQMQDTSQLHNIPLQIWVAKRKNERDGGMTNEVRGYRDINGNEPWKQQQQPQQQPQQGWGQPQQAPSQQGGWQAPQQPEAPQGAPTPGGWQTSPQTPPPGQQPANPQQGGGWQQSPAQPQQPQQGNGGWQQPQQPQQQQPQQGGGQQPWQQNPPTTPPWQR